MGSRVAGVLTKLAHSLPLFSSASMQTLVQVRKNESDAFIRYRSTINDLVRDRLANDKTFSIREIQDFYHDELEPILAELRSIAKNSKRIGLRNAGFVLTGSLLGGSLGYFTGLLPHEFGKMFQLAGGV